jgi:hypothetical protein
MKVEVQKGDRPPIINPTYAWVLRNRVFARILFYNEQNPKKPGFFSFVRKLPQLSR